MLVPILASLLTTAPSQARVDAARSAREGEVRRMFAAAGVPYPAEIFLRAFKEEAQLELWAAPRRGAAMVHVHTFAICAPSGELGPKRRRGDLQVPEGSYRIDRFNPVSAFHLSLGLDYPNARDHARERTSEDLGGNIFIHGGCVTIGCLPITDGEMEKLYLVALDARRAGQRTLAVDVFPTRLGALGWRRLEQRAAGRPELLAFWRTLQGPYEHFERTRRPPPRPELRPQVVSAQARGAAGAGSPQ